MQSSDAKHPQVGDLVKFIPEQDMGDAIYLVTKTQGHYVWKRDLDLSDTLDMTEFYCRDAFMVCSAAPKT